MNARATGLFILVIGALLAGCGGGGQSSSVVPLPGASTALATPGAKASVSFKIVIPKKTTAEKPAYVSPATQSMTVSIMQGSTSVVSETVSLTPTSTGCSSTLTSTQCTLQLSLTPGSYTASLTTYDGTNATGNELSTAQDVAFTVVQGESNIVPLTLSGVPAQILPSYAGNGQFYVAALDADGNYIIGPGAPSFTVAKASGSTVVSITQPTTTAPDAFKVAAVSVGTETLTVTAAYPSSETNGCAQTGAVCTVNFSVTGSQYLFAASHGNSEILGFEVPFTSASAKPVFTAAVTPETEYFGVAADPSGNFYYAGYSTSASPVEEISPPYTGSPTAGPSVPGYICQVLVGANSDLFVLSSGYSTTPAVYVYAPPYTGAAIATITTGLNSPASIALDADNDLFVANAPAVGGCESTPASGASSITEYAPPYTEATPSATMNTASTPNTVFVDASGDLWYDADTAAAEFTPPFTNSSTPAVTITNGIDNAYCPGTFDADGDLFIPNYSGNTITEYTKSSGYALAATIADATEPCWLMMDKAGDLYALTDTTSGSNGGIVEFTPPFSSSSTPAYTVTSGIENPNDGGAIAAPVTLTVSL